MPVTKKFLFSIMESAELLCNVTIESSRSKPTPERSVSHCISAPDCDQQTQPGEYLSRVALDLPHVDLRFRVTRETISRGMYENWKKRRSFFFSSLGLCITSRSIDDHPVSPFHCQKYVSSKGKDISLSKIGENRLYHS